VEKKKDICVAVPVAPRAPPPAAMSADTREKCRKRKVEGLPRFRIADALCRWLQDDCTYLILVFGGRTSVAARKPGSRVAIWNAELGNSVFSVRWRARLYAQTHWNRKPIFKSHRDPQRTSNRRV
jgi:hypothetical protein